MIVSYENKFNVRQGCFFKAEASYFNFLKWVIPNIKKTGQAN